MSGRRYTIWMIALPLVFAAVFGLAADRLFAQESSWSTPLNLGAYWYPDIAVDTDGNVYVTWSSSTDGYNLVMLDVRSDNGDWSGQNDVQASSDPLMATRPSISAGKEHILHLTYLDAGVRYSQAPTGRAIDAQAWTVAQEIGPGNFPRIVQDEKGILHLVYSSNIPSESCTVCDYIFYASSREDGLEWSDSVDISHLPTGAAYPQVMVSREGSIHVVYQAEKVNDFGGRTGFATAMHVVSSDGGQSWTDPSRVDPTRGDSIELQARNIAIAEHGNGQLAVVWWSPSDDLVYYQLSTDDGRTWSSPTTIPNVFGIWGIYNSRQDIYSMATDGQGDVHLVMVGRRSIGQENAALYHLEWNGTQWSLPEVIASYDGDMPEWPRIAIGLGNHLHVAWFVRDANHLYDPDDGQYRVYYSDRVLAIPGVSPQPVPPVTPASHSVQESIAMTNETSASIVAGAHLSSVQSLLADRPSGGLFAPQNIRSENDELLLLGAALLPVFALVALVMIIVRQRR